MAILITLGAANAFGLIYIRRILNDNVASNEPQNINSRPKHDGKRSKVWKTTLEGEVKSQSSAVSPAFEAIKVESNAKSVVDESEREFKDGQPKISNGTVHLDGMKPYSCECVTINNRGFSVTHMTDSSCTTHHETGPNFYIKVITSDLIGDLLRANEFCPFPATKFEFSGENLGRMRAYSGYHAAATGGDGRPIEELTVFISLDEAGLELSMTGLTGHIFENDCGTKWERFIKKNFSITLNMPIQEIPSVADVRTDDHVFERKYLNRQES